MSNPTYSDIIDPETYCRLMTEQHIGLRDSDEKLWDVMYREWRRLTGFVPEARGGDTLRIGGVSYPSEPEPPKSVETEIVELGCGPGRISRRLAHCPHHQSYRGNDHFKRFTGVDHDERFLEYAREKNPGMKFVLADVLSYQHHCPVDIFVSQGMHHHIPKGEDTPKYLRNVWKQLKPGGVYLVSDEFLSEYSSPEHRHYQSIIWHSHVISNALGEGYEVLAREEVKTLLDDLADGGENTKSPEQIAEVLKQVDEISLGHYYSHKEKKVERELKRLVKHFLKTIRKMKDTAPSNDPQFSLSRGGFKVSDSVFLDEGAAAGFEVDGWRRPVLFSLSDRGGHFSVYTLRKPA